MKPLLCAVAMVFVVMAGGGRPAAQPVVTRADVPAEGGFRAVTLLQGLEHPWAMAWLPGGDLLVTERPGRLLRVRPDGSAAGRISGVPEVFHSGQGGLLDVRLHPRFSDNHRVYFTFAQGTSRANRTCVARAVLEGDTLEDWQVIFEVGAAKSGSQHFGSRLLWLADGTLLVSVGDGGSPPVRLEGDWIRKQAQNRLSHLGKILRMTAEGSVPADNPFADTAGAGPLVYSYGHRNIQGLAFDPLRSGVWASEHGALGGDELNRIVAGGNYGWPAVTFSREYFDGSKISPLTSQPGMHDPAVVWMTAIAPSGLTVYTGRRFAGWHGDVLAGGLRSQDIRRIDLDDGGRIVGQSALRIGSRVRDVRQGPDELVYVLTDEDNGRLLRLEPVDDPESPGSP